MRDITSEYGASVATTALVNKALFVVLFSSCLWYLMEPLITKNESYSYSFYKKMIENIKQTKDAQNADNQDANMVNLVCIY